MTSENLIKVEHIMDDILSIMNSLKYPHDCYGELTEEAVKNCHLFKYLANSYAHLRALSDLEIDGKINVMTKELFYDLSDETKSEFDIPFYYD